MSRRAPGRASILSGYSVVLLFLLICFVVSISVAIFAILLETPGGGLEAAATATLVNIPVLSLLCALAGGLWRRVYIAVPLRRILEATRRIEQGDFSVRVQLGGTFPAHRRRNEFDDLADAINHMSGELEGVEMLRGDFIANVSHEMKTPLAVMQNYGTMLQKPGLSEDERIEYARAITASSRRLSSLITNVLRLNSLENQRIFPAGERFDLSEQLCECFLVFEGACERKSLRVDSSIQEGVEVVADRELLGLVWSNLFSNAVKFSNPEGRVDISLTVRNGWAVVRVADTGCGMSEEVRARAFEKFYQGDSSRAMQGNGLGLALVRRVTDVIGAQVSVKSAPGKGSEFTVRVPGVVG